MEPHELAPSPAEPLILRAGRFEADLEGGGLRAIRVDGTPVLDGIYAAVRDRHWGTVEPVFERYTASVAPGRFQARVDAVCRRLEDAVDVAWALTIDGDGATGLDVRFEALVRQPFLRARIGLCVLHPLRLAGSPVAIVTPWGRLRGRFPVLATANMPFSNITAIRQDIGKPTELELVFEGDLFQMEDQRAFTDPSFKTFSTPLELPWPVLVDAGTRIVQGVRLRAIGRPVVARNSGVTSGAASLIEVTAEREPLPAIGTQLPPPDVDLDGCVLEALRRIPLDFLRVDVADPDRAEAEIQRAALAAGELSLPLALSLVADGSDEELRLYATALAAARPRVARIAVYHAARHTTAPATLVRAKELFLRSGYAGVPLGGGSRGYAYQLLLDGLAPEAEFVEFAANPQVHATDIASILGTVDAMPALIDTASALAGGCPVHVAPITLRALVNPDVEGSEGPPPERGLPPRYDQRQPDVDTATWTLAMLAAIAERRAASATFHEAAGWGGLVAAAHERLPAMPASSGGLLPVAHALEAALPGADGTRFKVRRPSRLAASAVAVRDGWRLVIASRQHADEVVDFRLPRPVGEAAAAYLSAGPDPWVPTGCELLGGRHGRVTVPARGIVRLDLR